MSCTSICVFEQSKNTVSAMDSIMSLIDSVNVRKLILQKGRYLKSVMRYDEAAEVFVALFQVGRPGSEARNEL